MRRILVISILLLTMSIILIYADTESSLPETYLDDISPVTEDELIMLAKTVYGEARGLCADEQVLVAWCIFNRVDDNYHPNTIKRVITQPKQFNGYRFDIKADDETLLLCYNAIIEWLNGAEAPLLEPYAIKAGYRFFNHKRGKDGISHNYFRKDW